MVMCTVNSNGSVTSSCGFQQNETQMKWILMEGSQPLIRIPQTLRSRIGTVMRNMFPDLPLAFSVPELALRCLGICQTTATKTATAEPLCLCSMLKLESRPQPHGNGTPLTRHFMQGDLSIIYRTGDFAWAQCRCPA